MHFFDKCVASFPGSPHVQAMESWAGPGSEAIANLATFKTFCTTFTQKIVGVPSKILLLLSREVYVMIYDLTISLVLTTFW